MTTSQSDSSDRGGWFQPVVEVWVDDTIDGQSVIVVGERSDGQRFFGSFWQPGLDDETGWSQ